MTKEERLVRTMTRSNHPRVSKEDVIDICGDHIVSFRISASSGRIEELSVTDMLAIRDAINEHLKNVEDVEEYVKAVEMEEKRREHWLRELQK